MIYLLLALSIVFVSCKSSMYNSYAKSQTHDLYGVYKFHVVAYGVATLVALVIGIEKTVSLSTIIWASIYAVTVLAMQALSIASMTIGPMAATSLMVVYGLIIPTVAGPIFGNESFSILQGVGVVFILFSMWLITKGDNQSGEANKKMDCSCRLKLSVFGVCQSFCSKKNAQKEVFSELSLDFCR